MLLDHWPLKAIIRLSASLLLLLSLSFTCHVSAASLQLNSDTFSTSTASSMWLVEFFSPYCPHCKHFAPTWENIVELHGHLADSSDFHLAQVNCIEQGGAFCPVPMLFDAEGMLIFSCGRSLQGTINQRLSNHHAFSRW